MKAIIMAGGEGSRLRPLTCGLPKPMVPILNRPAMEYSIRLLRQHGITQIGVTLQYLPDAVKRYFGDGSRFGVELQYFVEEQPLGTAGSVKNAEEFLDGTFLVISGDAVTDVDLTQAARFHQEKGSCATLILKSVEIPLEYGVVVTDPQTGRIKRFLEKPNWSEVLSNTVNTGIYILEPELLRRLPEREMTDFSKDLFPALLEQDRPLYGFITEDYWCDIGDLSAYRQCQKDILSEKTGVYLGGVTTGNGIHSQGKVKIGRNTDVAGPVFFGKNVVIGKNCTIRPFTVIGDNCEIGDGTTIEGAVLWDGVVAGTETRLREAVICNEVRLENGCSVMEDAVIGEGANIGRQSVIHPKIKVWNRKNVKPNAELKSNLIRGGYFGGEVFGHSMMSGELGTDVTPELISKLGSAFGALSTEHARIGISISGSPAEEMIKSAFVAGLMSTGAEVYDFGCIPLAVMRFSVRAFDINGGVCFKVEGERATVRFINQFGADMERSEQRRLENILAREEFMRCEAGRFRPVTAVLNADDLYLKHALESCTEKRLAFSIAAYVSDEYMEELLGRVLTALGVKIQFVQAEEELSEFVTENQLNGGIVLLDGQSPVYITDRGRRISGETFFGLAALISMTAFKRSVLYVPADASDLVNYVARKLDCSVVRVKEFMTMGASYQSGINFLFYSLLFEPVTSVLRVLEFLQLNEISLTELVGMLPQIFKLQRDVDCPNTKKGKVVSNLITRFENVDLTEGVKVEYDNGWVLVLPDQLEGTCHIMAESYQEETAEELCCGFEKIVKELTEE